jgi:regulatory protein
MPEITRLVERRGRAKVFVNGEYWAELDAAVAAELGLFEGVNLPERELADARVAGERPLAMTRALNVLGYRARAEGELRERLLRAGYAPETVETVVGRLRELGYLDDAEFARNSAREKARKYGPRRVYGDLRKSGVGKELAREAVEGQFSEDSELEAAQSAAGRRYNKSERSDVVARRVYGFLVRRGYSANVCAEVAQRYRRGAGE